MSINTHWKSYDITVAILFNSYRDIFLFLGLPLDGATCGQKKMKERTWEQKAEDDVRSKSSMKYFKCE